MTRIFTILIASLSIMLFGLSTSFAAEQCFNQAGTYGNIEVSESGSGCGTFNGDGLFMGNDNSDENCLFNISPGIAGSSITLEINSIDAQYPTYAEELFVDMNGSQVHVEAIDFLSGYLKQSTGGPESPTIGGVTQITDAADNDGIIGFSNAPSVVTSIQLNHNWIIGAPNGSIYKICVDDESGPQENPTPVPATSTWALTVLILALLLSAGFLGYRRLD